MHKIIFLISIFKVSTFASGDYLQSTKTKLKMPNPRYINSTPPTPPAKFSTTATITMTRKQKKEIHRLLYPLTRPAHISPKKRVKWRLLEKPWQFDPVGHARFDPVGQNKIDPLKSWRRGSFLFYLILFSTLFSLYFSQAFATQFDGMG